jgi:hypothetical protein
MLRRTFFACETQTEDSKQIIISTQTTHALTTSSLSLGSLFPGDLFVTAPTFAALVVFN